MFEEPVIPQPVRFNPFKHHRNYILCVLNESPSEVIIPRLEPVCNNYIDIYIGTMTPEALCAEVISILQTRKQFERDEFSQWLFSGNGYRQIAMQDGSKWVVRKSNDEERYIHIHPARTGPFTIRIKGSTLKTVYLLTSNFGGYNRTLELQQVNQVRSKIGLSPIKRLERNSGILKFYKLFFNLP